MSRDILIRALRRVVAMADANIQGTFVEGDDLIALGRVDELAEMLRRYDITPPESVRVSTKRPINIEPSGEEFITHVGIEPLEAWDIAQTRAFMCPVCDDTGEVMRADSMGRRRSSGKPCHACKMGAGAPVTTIDLRSTNRTVTLGDEFAQVELQELATFAKDAPDRHVRKLAKLILDHHNVGKQNDLLRKRKYQLDRDRDAFANEQRTVMERAELGLRNPRSIPDRVPQSPSNVPVHALRFRTGRGVNERQHDVAVGDPLTSVQQTHLENQLFASRAARSVSAIGRDGAVVSGSASEPDIRAVLFANPDLSIIVDNNRSLRPGEPLTDTDVAALTAMIDNIQAQIERASMSGQNRQQPTAQRRVKKMYAEYLLNASLAQAQQTDIAGLPLADAERWNVRINERSTNVDGTISFNEVRYEITLGERMPDIVRIELRRRLDVRPRSPDMVEKCYRFLRAEPVRNTALDYDTPF